MLSSAHRLTDGASFREAVRTGRRSEYAWAYAEYGDEVPDALAASTFQSAVLDWNERAEPAAQRRQSTVQQMLAIRRREIVPRLAGTAFGDAKAASDGLLTASWRMPITPGFARTAGCSVPQATSRAWTA